MTKNNALSLSVGLVISLIITGIFCYFLFIEIFDIFGHEALIDPERRDAKVFYTFLLLTLMLAGLAILLYTLKRKYCAIGFGSPSIIALSITLFVGSIFLNKSNYYEEFDHKKWMTQERGKIKMARQLIKTKELVGLTKFQLIEKLDTVYFFSFGVLSYKVEGDFCGLGIEFENDTVTHYYIWVMD